MKKNKEVCDPRYGKCPIPESLRFIKQEKKRLKLIQKEFDEGFSFLYRLKKTVTIFGSARFSPRNPYYKLAYNVARALAKDGFTIVTGGGGGIMEAGNKAAYDVGSGSVGLNIELPHEQRVNDYVKQAMSFHYFFSRKVMLSASAQAYVYFPGGYGTLNELFEIIELIQTRKMERVPIILVGSSFWKPLVTFLAKDLATKHRAISPEDVGIFEVVDTPKEVLAIVRNAPERRVF